MDTDLFSFLFNTFLFFGVILAIKDRGRINSLLQRLNHLQKVIDFQVLQIEKLKQKIEELRPSELSKEQSKEQLKPEPHKPIEPLELEKIDSHFIQKTTEEIDEKSKPWQDNKKHTRKKSKQIKQPKNAFSFDSLLKGNGIFWLGAAVLAIGGIFLAKYSIEAGLLSPSIRVILGAVFGCSLVIAAELANKYQEKLNIQTPYISASLASGGVITCFAMALVSFDFYNFITPNIAFALLAIISLTATYLALRFGPILAGIGIIGSYAVPALVSTGSNDVFALLVYVAFVSLSAIWVADYVKQKWLWWQSFVGHFIWLAAAIVIGDKSDFWLINSFAIFSLYLYVLAGVMGWKLSLGMTSTLSVKELLMPRREQAVILLSLVLMALYLTLYNDFIHIIWANVIFCTVIILVANKHSALDSWPYLMLGFALYSFHLMPNTINFENNLFPFSNKYLFIQLSVLVGMAFSLFMLIRYVERYAYLLLLVITPITLFGISYITAKPEAEAYLYPLWAVEMLLIGVVASYGAMKSKITLHQVTYLILANSLLTLCLTMLLSASTLTLAIVTQVASLSYLSWKYKVHIPDWLYKVALLAVVTRLTFAPWLANYKDEMIFNVHWTLIVYPIVLVIIGFATKYNPSKTLKSWFMGVFIHVFALLITTETSYILINDYPDFTNLSYKESILLSLNWLILSAVYLFRSKLTSSLRVLYQKGGLLLILGAALIHIDISLISNPFVQNHYVGDGVINWLFLQWLVPAGILCIFIKFKLFENKYHNAIYGVIAVLGILFVNGEIRSLFNDGHILWASPLKQAELYTYSIVWLVISTLAIFVAQHFDNKSLMNAGFTGLAIVILKAFGIDMSHLEGLLRALSFIGLGLCLVGIGWLFQKMQNKTEVTRINT